MIQGHLMLLLKPILLSDGTMDCVVGLNVVAQQEVEGVQVQHIQVCDPERSKLDIVPLSLQQYHSGLGCGVEIWTRFACKRCYSIDFCRGTILQILFWNITERKSVKIYRCSTLHITPSLRSSKIIQRQKPEVKKQHLKKKKTTLQHLCPLFPAFFLSHTQTCAYTHSRSSGAAVRWSASVLGSSCSPVRAESRPGLDRAAVAVRSQEHRPPVHRTWAARSLIQSWQQRAPLQPPAPSLTPAAPFPARWRGELTWEGRGEGRGC